MTQKIATWKKIIYPLIALVSVPLISLISIFTVPSLTDTWDKEMTTAQLFYAIIFLFIFSTIATYLVMMLLACTVDAYKRWSFVQLVFWGYVGAAGIASLLYQLKIFKLVIPIHMTLFSIYQILFEEWILSLRLFFVTLIGSLLEVVSLVIIYYLLRRKFKI